MICKRLIGAAAASAVAAVLFHPGAGADTSETDGLGPCQDAPYARLDLHPRLEEHLVDGVRVLVLRPDNFDPRRRYPVLYLLHGGISVPDEWVTRMGIEGATAGRDVIVVMPDGGRAGFYRDWASGGRTWETFHTERLIRWVDESFPTLGDRSHRAVAGLSMGGGGAMYYAARHPDLFGSVASFSGVPLAFMNAADHTLLAAFAHDMQERCERDQTGVQLFGVYGNPVTDEVAVRDNMPEDLAPGLSRSLVYLSAGDGIPIDGEQRRLATEHPDYALLEPLIRNQANAFTATLTEQKIEHVYDQPHGAHWWATFRTGLDRFVGILFDDGFGRPAPSSFDYRTARDRFAVWGWDFALTGRTKRAFTAVREASLSGFGISGHGTATVTTPALFHPHERVRVRIGIRTAEVRASHSGRLTVTLPLGTHDLRVRFERR